MLKILTLIISLFIFEKCAVFNAVSASSQSLDSVSTSLNSISTGLKSVSSISGSLASISGSSMDEAKPESLFKMDARDLTYFYATSNLGKDWEKDMAEIAHKNGLFNWKEISVSYIAVGEGLKKAGLSNKEFETVISPVKTKNKDAYQFLKKGFNSYEI
ncbi:MAG: putative lipoprotein [Leptospiraceae bacterium]|nr:putative lipoprotein [Leptospiraceae bacterium]